MNSDRPDNQTEERRAIAAQIGWQPILQFAVFVILLPLVLFAAAGRPDWRMAWTYVGVHVGFTAVSRLITLRRNPDLLAERARSLQAEDVKGPDRLLMVTVGLLGPLVIWIVVGLDERFGWSPELALAYQFAALTLVVAGYALGTWALVVNAYFSGVVRIQEERGQTVVKTGPYRLVRHPAYAGAALTYLAMPVMLDSLWGLVPAVLTVLALWIRTLLEDRVLTAELPGYAEYAQETRYRLVPGIW